MLPRGNRIQKKKEIDRVFKEGAGFKEGLLALKTVKNNLSYPRFCFIVSKKISSRACVRNRLKRRLREAAKSMMAGLKNNDSLLISLPGMEKKQFSELRELVHRLFKRADILK